MRLFVLVLLASPLLARAAGAQEFVEFPDTNPELVGGIAGLQERIVYPEAERRDGVEGRVIVQFDVGPAGTATDIRAVRSVNPGLDSAAVRAVRASRFTAPTHEGRSVRTRLSLPVTFRIRDNPSPGAWTVPTLGQRWANERVPEPDSGAVTAGRGRLVFDGHDGDIERLVIVVEDSLVVEAISTFAPASRGLEALRDMERKLASVPGVRRRADGFVHAVDLIVLGSPVTSDVAPDVERRTLRVRLPRCQTSSRYPECVSLFPVPIGGFAGIAGRVRLRSSERPVGRIVVDTRIDRDGSVAEASVQSNAVVGGPSQREVEDAVLAAVRATRFAMGPNASAMAPDDRVQFSVPVTFAGGD